IPLEELAERLEEKAGRPLLVRPDKANAKDTLLGRPVVARLVVRDVAAAEDRPRERERDRGEERGDPDCADDWRPRERRHEEAVPAVELVREQVVLGPALVYEARDRFLAERVHEGADDRGGAVPRPRREQDREGCDRDQREREDAEGGHAEPERVQRRDPDAAEVGQRIEPPGERSDD